MANDKPKASKKSTKKKGKEKEEQSVVSEETTEEVADIQSEVDAAIEGANVAMENLPSVEVIDGMADFDQAINCADSALTGELIEVDGGIFRELYDDTQAVLQEEFAKQQAYSEGTIKAVRKVTELHRATFKSAIKVLNEETVKSQKNGNDVDA
jgi:hypothetical protein